MSQRSSQSYVTHFRFWDIKRPIARHDLPHQLLHPSPVHPYLPPTVVRPQILCLIFLWCLVGWIWTVFPLSSLSVFVAYCSGCVVYPLIYVIIFVVHRLILDKSILWSISPLCKFKGHVRNYLFILILKILSTSYFSLISPLFLFS